MSEKGKRIDCKENNIMQLAILSVIGDRNEQQDAFGYDIKDDSAIVTVCDGMGGHMGGRLAGQTSVNCIIEEYMKLYPNVNVPVFLRDIADEADRRVSSLTDTKGTLLNAGSTMVAVVLWGNDFYWSSVGDSRLYMLRNNEFVQVTVDHNYKEYLKEKLSTGEISREEYDKEIVNGEALINYIGVGRIQITDHNDTPLKTEKDDIFLLMSDGLYKMLSDNEIKSIIDNFSNPNDALNLFDSEAEKKASEKKLTRDNMTVAIIKIK